jgi:aspartyl-tRNA synthetase
MVGQRILVKNTINCLSQKIKICGWVNNWRTHGQILFVDLRDKSGILQIVFSNKNKPLYELAKKLRPEWVICIEGTIKERPKGMQNPKIETGKIELEAENLEVLSKAKTLPFAIDSNGYEINEEKRLKYRYLDLRRERMKKNLMARNKIIQFIREYLAKEDFIEIQTPILSKSTPEGARDYLIPARLHPGKFFALPQSPQQYKQLLMAAGFEKYFQIAPCFRDEAARADRSPGEFYQLDLEMSFVQQKDILNLMENLLISLVKNLFPEKKIKKIPFPKIPYETAIKKYKSDKPDLRNNKKNADELAFCWIVDFPLFQKQEKEDFFHGAGKKLAPSHHMFTAPKKEDINLLDKDPLKAKSYQHDLVLNGVEIGGGSIRIHDPKIQKKIFDLIGFNEEQKKRFSHLLTAFEYGVPPHGGIAPGLDRLVRILLAEENIRETVAFPLSGDARDLMMDSPSEVEKEQLEELKVEITTKKNKKS